MLRRGCQPLLPAGLRSPETLFFFFLIGGPLLYNMVLVSAIHQHGSALCETCPPSTTSLPSRLSQSPCVSSVSHMAHPPWSVLHVLVCTFPCYSLHSSHLSLPSESTSLLFMRDTQSASPWAEWSPCGREPKGDAQGVRIETDSSPAPECGFSPSQPPSGVSLFIESPSSPPSWEQAPGYFLPPRGLGVLGHSLLPILSSPASFRGY